MPFSQRRISVTVVLADNPGTNQPNVFQNTNSNTATFSDLSGPQLRIIVRIQNSGSPSYNTAQVQMFGLPLSVMNQLSTLGMQLNLIPKNAIQVKAGDAVSGMSAVFTGTIQQAYGDFSAMPNVPFYFDCRFGLDAGTALAKPTSYSGSTSVASIMQNFSNQLTNCSFENNGVTATLNNPYFRGSLIDQIAACRDHAGIGAEFVDGGTTLAIFPKFGSRNTPSPPMISKQTGMIAYPSYTQQGILVHTLFNPAIRFFGLVQTESSFPKASGTWSVHKLDLALDAMVPKGEWKMDRYCYNPTSATPIIPPP